MKLIKIEVQGATPEQLTRYKEILEALLTCGGLDGMKNGKTILNFDHEAQFKSVQFDYTPWMKRKPY